MTEFGKDKVFEGFQGIFEDFFGGASQGKGRGADLSMPLRLSLHEAVHGCTREIEVPRRSTCTRCSGSGGASTARFTTCAACSGRRQTTTKRGAFELATPCETCRGRGGQWSIPCAGCDATGEVADEPSRVKVTVPPSVRPGQQLRLPGQGHRPKPDAKTADGSPPAAGHLYLAIEIDLPRGLSIEGDHLVASVRLDADKAARGGTLTVPWIDGAARVSVPPRTPHDARIVKRGWGLLPLNTPFSPPPEAGAPYRSVESGARGDLVVVVSHGSDPDAILDAELAALPAQPPTASVPPEVRALAVGLAIVAATIGYLLLSR
jgi:molecular chaperone DnaJ